jgi:hypothetical protein
MGLGIKLLFSLPAGKPERDLKKEGKCNDMQL